MMSRRVKGLQMVVALSRSKKGVGDRYKRIVEDVQLESGAGSTVRDFRGESVFQRDADYVRPFGRLV